MQDIMLDGADNVRDFGGTVNREGRVIRPELLIRSNHLNALTEACRGRSGFTFHYLRSGPSALPMRR